MGARVVTVNEVLGGHVQLDIECPDRVYLNAYVPILQSSGQVVAFMTQHLGLPIPSPALFDKIGQQFRRAVAAFPEANDIGRLQCKAYTKGEHVLRFEATVHNTKELRCRRSLDNFPEIITALAGIAERFATILDCADISFIADGLLDQLPLPSHLGATRTGGIDLNKPRIRAALAAALTLAAAPHGFTVAQFTAQARQLGHNAGYTIRQGAYDLRKLRGKGLAVKLGTTRRYHVPAAQARTITALLAIRDQVIAPILAGVRSPRQGRKPAHWTLIDRDYETLRIGMQNLFHDLGITPSTATAA